MFDRRPLSVPFPFVWAEFEKVKNGQTYKFEIREAAENESEELLNFLTSYFMRDETFNEAVGIAKDPLAIEEFKELFRYVIAFNFNLVCYDVTDRSKPIIASANILLHSKEGPDPDFSEGIKSTAIKNLFKVFKEVMDAIDLYKEFGVKDYITGGGLSTHPDYRGMGLAKEVLRSRDPMCKAFGIKLSSASFTGIESQTLAEKCGYRTVCALEYEKLGEKHGITFNPKTKYCKIMVYEYE